MNDQPHIDPERLAALLDGRLGEAEAAAVRAQLASADDDTLGAYADAAAVGGAAMARDAFIAIKPGVRWRRWIATTAVAMAAVIMAVVVLRPAAPSIGYQPLAYARAIPRSASSAPVVWSATRGSTLDISDRARAVRVGALLTDIEYGVMHGEPTAVHVAAMTSLLEDIPGASEYAAPLRAYSDAPNDRALSGDPRREVGKQILGYVDGPLANAGAWLEAARVASSAGDASFFERFPAAPLSAVEGDDRIDASMRSAIDRVVERSAVRPLNATALRGDIEEALRLLGQ